MFGHLVNCQCLVCLARILFQFNIIVFCFNNNLLLLYVKNMVLTDVSRTLVNITYLRCF